MKKILVIILGLFAITVSAAYAWNKGFLPEKISSLFDSTAENITNSSPIKKFLDIKKTGETAKKSIENLPDAIKNADLKTIAHDAGEQLSTTASKAGEISEHAKNVLGSSVQVGEEKKPVHEKALEYGQYVYCQQVVNEWEARN